MQDFDIKCIRVLYKSLIANRLESPCMDHEHMVQFTTLFIWSTHRVFLRVLAPDKLDLAEDIN